MASDWRAVIEDVAREDGAYFDIVAGKPLPDWAAEFDAHTWAQFMLKFVVAHPAVTVAAPGTSFTDTHDVTTITKIINESLQER